MKIDRGVALVYFPPLCPQVIAHWTGFGTPARSKSVLTMWQAAGSAARAAGRFARRHRRAIVVGGVVGAAACVYHSMKKALKEVSTRGQSWMDSYARICCRYIESKPAYFCIGRFSSRPMPHPNNVFVLPPQGCSLPLAAADEAVV